MPYKSQRTVNISEYSLPTFLFKSPTAPLGSKVAFSEAARPGTHYLTRDQFRLWAQPFALGVPAIKALEEATAFLRCTCSFIGWDPRRISLDDSAGQLYGNCEAKIMTDDGTSEITTRGPSAHNPEATAATLTPDGWLRTGDIAYADDDMCFFIVDWKKELIKVKGNQVAPTELEALLLEHPGIADAAVIGMPTEDGDEKPRAFVVRQVGSHGAKLTEEDVKRFVYGKVVRYKLLAGGAEFVDAIPKNPSGKILRRHLRDVTRERMRREGVRL